jgi:membrane dipeptidase
MSVHITSWTGSGGRGRRRRRRSDVSGRHGSRRPRWPHRSEGGDFLDGDLRRLEEARAAGVTVLTLVHCRFNEIGDVQTEPPVHGGLSRFGRAVVAECNRLGIMVDCAHASYATTMAVLKVSSQPVIISHGQLDHAGTAHPRLPTTTHVAAVAAAGGLIGAWRAG